jgi:hypothetical protein
MWRGIGLYVETNVGWGGMRGTRYAFLHRGTLHFPFKKKVYTRNVIFKINFVYLGIIN